MVPGHSACRTGSIWERTAVGTHVKIARARKRHLQVMEPGRSDSVEPVHHFLKDKKLGGGGERKMSGVMWGGGAESHGRSSRQRSFPSLKGDEAFPTLPMHENSPALHSQTRLLSLSRRLNILRRGGGGDRQCSDPSRPAEGASAPRQALPGLQGNRKRRLPSWGCAFNVWGTWGSWLCAREGTGG